MPPGGVINNAKIACLPLTFSVCLGKQQSQVVYQFGPFRVDPEKEILLRHREPVPLTPKAFQILLVLIRQGPELVSKDELMKAVWPDTFVEEANLSRNIFLLRKALGRRSARSSLRAHRSRPWISVGGKSAIGVGRARAGGKNGR